MTGAKVVGYCYSCVHFKPWLSERTVIGVARFGRCTLGVISVAGIQMCERYAEKRA